jgi:multicomponent Na+:H+ antiporter subunit F
VPEAVAAVGLAWETLLQLPGGDVLLRSRDTLHCVLALHVLVSIVVAQMTILSYLRDVSYYVDGALALGLLSLVSTVVAVRHVLSGRPS